MLLEEKVHNYKEHNDKLVKQVKSLVTIILPLLPSDIRSVVQQQFEQVLSQQESPRQKEPPRQQEDDYTDYGGY